MSKIARVKFIRDKEPNIKALTAGNKVLDGALYVATDTGTLWMGISSSSLIQIKDNINTNTTYNLTKSGSTITLRGSDGSTFNVTDSNTVYGNATTSAAGLMSAADKAKLDGVATGSNHVTVDTALSADSTNPVQNKVIKSALDGKSNTGHTHDDRYYTESEINTKLNAKANSSHTHTKSQITDFPTSMPASDVYSWAKQSSKPNYTISEVSGNLPASRISGTISASNLPSYVDDVLEYASFSNFPTKGESGKIYTALDTNRIYRWSGSAYIVISATLALGTTHATAGYGDESRAAYNHSTSTGNPHKTTKTDLGLGNVENKSSATIRGELTSANVTTALGYTPPRTDTNTHFTTRIVAGAANGTANATTTNGNTHINVKDDDTFRSGVVIKGTGATSVTSDASGNITVYSTDTDTWRPIQNNLTSTATDQSLSAAQGKALNDKFGSYVPTSRTVNGKALSTNITLSAGDVGAAPASHSHSYLPLAGGTMTGPIKFNANSLPVRDSQDFLVGIDAFDQGGTLKRTSADSVKVGSATKATQDSAGQQINTTYIKGLSVNGRTVTYTRGDGTTGTITTQDTNTTYNNVTTSTSGLMTAADKRKLDALGETLTITKSLTLKTDWMDTGISGTNLGTGTYIVQVSGLSSDDGISTYSEIWSGVMSWYSGGTNSTNAEEILLHNAGHADASGEIYLRTARTRRGNYLKLQIASNIAATKADNIVFKFRRLL